MSPRDRQKASRLERRKTASKFFGKTHSAEPLYADEAQLFPELPGDAATSRPSLRLLPRLFALLRGGTLLTLAATCIGIFYVAVILGEAQDLERTAGQQPSATAMPRPPALPGGQRVYETTDIAQLEALLPARLATLPERQGFELESGKVEDLRLPGVATSCRAVTLIYRHSALRDRVVVHSAVPGGYLQRFALQDYTLERDTATLGSLPAILLSTEDRHYYIASQGEAVYAIEGLSSTPDLSSVPGWVMLSGPAPESSSERETPVPAF